MPRKGRKFPKISMCEKNNKSLPVNGLKKPSMAKLQFPVIVVPKVGAFLFWEEIMFLLT